MSPLLEVTNLQVSFSIQGKELQAVRGISFSLFEGEALGIVGESGSGKSATMHTLLGLNDAKVQGKALFQGKDLLNRKTLNQVRGTQIAMIFQDPLTSLNPTMKIGAQIMEGILFHRLLDRQQAKKRALELLDLVKIPNSHLRFDQYPHQLSGGMRQRALIAIALSCKPRLLIADEATTALDTVTQAQILTLLKDLQKEFNMTLCLITHDFGFVAEICDRVLVFHQGLILEQGLLDEILYRPKHPYTQMLLSCVPKICF